MKYSEIGLRGKNKGFFEKRLVNNIKLSAQQNKVNLLDVKVMRNCVFCIFDDERAKIDETLRYVFGIRYFAYVCEVGKSIEEIEEKVREILKDFKKRGVERVAFKTKRSDKRFALTSVDVNSKLGRIVNELEMRVDYENPQETIFVEITDKVVYVYFERIDCDGGLPVGTEGKVLCLLSGGIDSPVAAWSMMRRGCIVDFVHFHSFSDNETAFESKIGEIVRFLNRFEFKSRIYLVPYSVYDVLVSGKVHSRYEVVFFKHFILKFAQKLVKDLDYDAIVLGDNLAQVASQTLENIKAASFGIDVPIFRPLLTFEKEEIVNLARRIGSYDLSVLEYKDCCSLISGNQITRANFDKFVGIVKEIDFDNLVDKCLDKKGDFEVK